VGCIIRVVSFNIVGFDIALGYIIHVVFDITLCYIICVEQSRISWAFASARIAKLLSSLIGEVSV
jgi:hypothetical protein